MKTVTVTIVIETDNTIQTKKAVEEYLQESMEKDFLEPNEQIKSIKVK